MKKIAEVLAYASVVLAGTAIIVRTIEKKSRERPNSQHFKKFRENLKGEFPNMTKKELRKLTKEQLVQLLREYGDNDASVTMKKEDLIQNLIDYSDIIEDLFPNANLN